MNSTSIKIKKFLSNRNTVAIICALIAIVVLIVGYRLTINNAVQPVRVPFAKETIQPRTLISIDKIDYMELPQVAVNKMGDNLIKDAREIENHYSNINTVIPQGSFFYKTTVVDKKKLPDAAVYQVEKGEVLEYFQVNMATSYINSIVPGGYIDIYVRRSANGTTRVGKLFENVEVLGVKTSDGLDVFENSDERRTPAYILFKLSEENYMLLAKAKALQISLIPVPTNAKSIAEENEEEVVFSMTSEELKEEINMLVEEYAININTITKPELDKDKDKDNG